MKIPEIARRIRQIAEEIRDEHEAAADELLELAAEMRRRPSGLRAPSTSTPMTEELAAEIREFKENNPQASQQEIAEHFNVNHGRVSEVLSGMRT